MEPDPLVILGKRIVLGDTALAHDAGNGLRFRHALLLYEKLQRAIAPAARRDLEHAGFVAFCIDDGPDIQALQQGTLHDALGELLDRHAGLGAPDVGLAQHQLVKGNVT